MQAGAALAILRRPWKSKRCCRPGSSRRSRMTMKRCTDADLSQSPNFTPLEQSIARALTRLREEVAGALLPQLTRFPKFAEELSRAGEATADFIRRELIAFADYLTLRFRTGDVSYRHLYVGEKLK